MIFLSRVVSLLSLALAANSKCNCKAVTFTANGTAQNRAIDDTAPLTNFSALVDYYNSLPFITISGPQTIAAVYCTPLISNENNAALRFLAGSITTDHTQWTAMGGVGSDYPPYNPEKYSWTLFANKQGYPTLAIDRLGTGRSSHPDPYTFAQAPYE